MPNGASIRTTGSQGLRFYANLTNESATGQGFYVIYGEASILDLEDAISVAGENDIIINGKKVFKVEVAEREVNGDFSVVLTGIPEVGYLQKITAIAYAVVDGVEEFVDAGVTRSIGEVAYKMSLANERSATSDDILRVIDNSFKSLVLTSWGTLEESSAIFETNPSNLRDVFIADWNIMFGTNWTNLLGTTFAQNARIGSSDAIGANENLSTTRIYQFFNDSNMNQRWGWMLDYFIDIDNITHARRQALAIKGEGTVEGETFALRALYLADHLSYSIANFFNGTHVTGYSTAMNFTIPTGISRYRLVVNYNKHIIRNLEFNELDENDSEIILPDYYQEGMIFEGWYDNPSFSGNPVVSTILNQESNQIYYPKLSEPIPTGLFVTFDYGSFGYHTTTKEDLFLEFVTDYKNFYARSATIEAMLSNFYDNSFLPAGMTIMDIFNDSVMGPKWSWLRDYIKDLAESVNYSSKAALNDPTQQGVWRSNITSFWTNSVRVAWPASINFTNLENANNFWSYTQYNQKSIEFNEVFNIVDTEDIMIWNPDYEFVGWYDAEVGGNLVTSIEELTENITLYARYELK